MHAEELNIQGKSYSFSYPAVMGILNITPDSFSDGGQFNDPARAIERAHQMIAEGAQVIDVGAESTRPGSKPIPAGMEMERLLPVVKALLQEGICVSVDTNKFAVQQAMLDLGVPIINDIYGGSAKLYACAGKKQAALILMHTPAAPEKMQEHTKYEDVLLEVRNYFLEKEKMWRSHPIPKIWLDPGIGFGKRLNDNLRLMANLSKIQLPGTELLLGSSRKSWLKDLCQATVENRLAGSLASAIFAYQQGAQIIRVHDVYETTQALQAWQALQSHSDNDLQSPRT